MIKRFEVSLKNDAGETIRNRTFNFDFGDNLQAASRKFDPAVIHAMFAQSAVIQFAANIRTLMADRKNTDAMLDAAVAKLQPSLGRTADPAKQDARAAKALARYSEADIARILKLAAEERKGALKRTTTSAKGASKTPAKAAKKTTRKVA